MVLGARRNVSFGHPSPASGRLCSLGTVLVAALAIRETIAERLPDQEVGLKWPNDVVVAGGKICGLLLEARDGAVVIGTGVNIAPVPAVPGGRLPAISLRDLGDAAAMPAMLAEAYATRLLAGAASVGA